MILMAKTQAARTHLILRPSKKDPRKRRWQKPGGDDTKTSRTVLTIEGVEFRFKRDRKNENWLVHSNGTYIDRIPASLPKDQIQDLITKRAPTWLKRAKKRRPVERVSEQMSLRYGTADKPSGPRPRPSGEKQAAPKKLSLKFVETAIRKYGGIKIPGTPIKGPGDIASIFKEMKNEAREKLWVVGLDKNDRVKSVELHSMGGINTSTVDSRIIVAVLDKSKARKYYRIHNHPSGASSPSNEDVMSSQQVAKLAKELGIEYQGDVIIHGGRDWYTEFNSLTARGANEHLKQSQARIKGKLEKPEESKISELYVRRRVKAPENMPTIINDSRAAARLAKWIQSEGGRGVHVACLNTRNQVTGLFLLGDNRITDPEQIKEYAVDMIRHLHNTGGVRAIVVSNEKDVKHTPLFTPREAASRFFNSINEKLKDYEVLDAVFQTGENTYYSSLEETSFIEKSLAKSMTWSGHKLQDRMTYQGMDISIENKAGTYRSGIDPNGKKWRTKLHYPYGYVRRTQGADKDHLDCFIGWHRMSQKVFIVHQHKIDKVEKWPKGRCPQCKKRPAECMHDYDEDKVMLGWDTKERAIRDYLKNYDTDKMLGPVTEMSLQEFKKKAFLKKNHGNRLKKGIARLLRARVAGAGTRKADESPPGSKGDSPKTKKRAQKADFSFLIAPRESELAKARIKGHYRRTKSSKVVYVREHEDKRSRKEETMYAVVARFSPTQYEGGRQKFLGLRVVAITPSMQAFQQLPRRRDLFIWSTRKQAEEAMKRINPETCPSAKVRGNIYAGLKWPLEKSQKGAVKPGHKYIKREGSPGSYKYTYWEEQRVGIGDRPGEREAAPKESGQPKVKVETKELKVNDVVRDPDQPRTHFDEKKLKELGESIRKVGLIQDIAVRPDPKETGKFRIIAGERRWRASKLAGLDTIRARIYKLTDPKEIYAIQVAENVGRQEMNPIETANAFKRLHDAGVSTEDIAKKVGAAPVTVERKMMLTNLTDALQERIANGDIPVTQGIIIAMGSLRPAYQRNILNRLNAGKVSNEALTGLVGKYRMAQEQTSFFDEPEESDIVAGKVHKNTLRALDRQMRDLITEMSDLIASMMDKDADKIIPAMAKEKGQLALTAKKLQIMTDQLNKLNREMQRAQAHFKAGGTIGDYLESRGIGKKKERKKKTAKLSAWKVGDKLKHPSSKYPMKIVQIDQKGYALENRYGKVIRMKGKLPPKKKATKKTLAKSLLKAIRGYMKPDHKYIRREGSPGEYRYFYADEKVQQADVLLDVVPTRTDLLAVKFDFKWGDPEWERIKDAIKTSGARFHGDTKTWWVQRDKAHLLLENVKKVAVSSRARQLLKVPGGTQAQERREEKKEVQAPGSRGSVKWWIDARGKVQYGEKPKGRKEIPKNAIDRAGYYEEFLERALEQGNKESLGRWQGRIEESTKRYLDNLAAERGSGRLKLSTVEKDEKDTTIQDYATIIQFAKEKGYIRIASRGRHKGKVVIDAKPLRNWPEHDADREVQHIFDGMRGWERGNFAQLAPPRTEFHMRPTHYQAQISKLITAFNEGNPDPVIDAIFAGKVKGKDVYEQAKAVTAEAAQIERHRRKAIKALNNKNPVQVQAMKEGKSLWPHQNQYLNWMLAVDQGVVGADTALGKTLTALAYIKKMKDDGKIEGGLAFLPGSVMYGWEDDLKEFFKDKAKVLYIDGTPEQKMEQIKTIGKKQYDLIVASHGMMQGESPLLRELLRRTKKHAVFYDEAHKGLLNTQNLTYKTFQKHIKQKYRFLMTATPARNEPLDLMHLNDLLYPGHLGNAAAFHREYYEKISGKWHPRRSKMDQMWERVKPYVPVMSKYTTGVKLPQRVDRTEKLTMGDQQRKYYKAAETNLTNALLAVENPDAMTRSESNHIFKILAELRLTSFDPTMINPAYRGESVIFERANDVIGDHLAAGRRGIVVASAFTRPFAKYKARLRKEHRLSDSEIAIIDKSTPPKERKAIQDRMNAGRVKVLLMGVASGGAGMNLQKGADAMIVLSDPWTYADKKQAVDRIIRPGAKSDTVFVTDFSIPGTVTDVVRGKVRMKETMHRTADVEGSAREKMATWTFGDFLKVAGMTRADYQARKKTGRETRKTIMLPRTLNRTQIWMGA